jgi:thiol-disulfide isomerase/thioredoxin
MTNHHPYLSLQLAAAIILLVGLGAAVLQGASRTAGAVDLTLADVNGKRVHLRDYRGQVVVLNFWATWCGPCAHEMPLFVQAEKDYKSRGVTFIGASVDESKTRPGVLAFISKYDVTFPVWMGGSGDDLAKLGMGEAVPATAFLDQGGRIIARVLGEIRGTEITERIEWLLSDRTGAAPDALVRHLP